MDTLKMVIAANQEDNGMFAIMLTPQQILKQNMNFEKWLGVCAIDNAQLSVVVNKQDFQTLKLNCDRVKQSAH